MPTLESPTTKDIHPDAQRVLDLIERQIGVVPAIMRTLAANPGLLKGFVALNTASNSTKLDAGLRDLAYLKVSHLNGCDYCAYYHRHSGLEAGLTEEQIQAIAHSETSPVYTTLQREVMRYAEQVTRNIHPDAQLVKQLQEQLSDTELMELTLVVGLANLTNRFNVALKLELP